MIYKLIRSFWLLCEIEFMETNWKCSCQLWLHFGINWDAFNHTHIYTHTSHSIGLAFGLGIRTFLTLFLPKMIQMCSQDSELSLNIQNILLKEHQQYFLMDTDDRI